MKAVAHLQKAHIHVFKGKRFDPVSIVDEGNRTAAPPSAPCPVEIEQSASVGEPVAHGDKQLSDLLISKWCSPSPSHCQNLNAECNQVGVRSSHGIIVVRGLVPIVIFFA